MTPLLLVASLPLVILPFAYAVVVALTWPLSALLLRLFRRAVHRSMSESSGERTLGQLPTPPLLEHPAAAVRCKASAREASRLLTGADLERTLAVGPWITAARYGGAGLLYAMTMATAVLASGKGDSEPTITNALIYTTIFAWPIVIVTAVVASATKGPMMAVVAGYLVALAAVCALNPSLTVSAPLYNLGPTLLILASMSRRIRAVGPLVVGFLFIVLLGIYWVIILVLGTTGIVATGIVATGIIVLVAILASSLVTGAVWGITAWVRRGYETKRISDQSLTVDAIWLTFAFGYATVATVVLGVSPFAPFVAFVVYKVAVVLSRPKARHQPRSARLLLLRSFSIGPKSERLFMALQKHWRHAGSIQLIAGYDLVFQTVQPHEFLDFLTGRLGRRFIGSEAALAERLDSLDLERDQDGRFRVNDFFCYDDTWQITFLELARASDIVLMDLRGFSSANLGCEFEIQQLAQHVSSERVVYIVDERTDEGLLREVIAVASRVAEPPSDVPHGTLEPRIFRIQRLGNSTLRNLLSILAVAAAADRRSPLSQELAR